MNESSSQSSMVKKVGIGAAILAVPAGAVLTYRALEHASDAKAHGLEQRAQLDTAAVRKVDPASIKYHEAGRIETGLQSPNAITVDSQGRLYVGGDQKIVRISRDGAGPLSISLGDAPYAMAVDNDGTLFVALRDHVDVYDAAGKKLSSWATLGSGAYLSGVAVHGNDVWVADSGHRLVMHYDRNGKVLGDIGKPDPSRGIEGLLAPSPHIDVHVDADGLVWVSNPGRYRLEAYKSNGQLEKYWGSNGTNVEAFFGCCNPADFAILPDGRFITAEKGIARVKTYLADGRFEGVVAPPAAFAENVVGLDVASDAQGCVLVLERGTRQVRVFVANESGTAMVGGGGQ